MNEIYDLKYDLKYTFSPHWQRTTFVIFSRRLAHDGDWGEEGGGYMRVALYLEAMAD